MFQRFFYRILCYLMEDNAFWFLQAEHFGYVPCDSFTLAVRVSGQVNILSPFGAGSQFLDYFFLVLIYFIVGDKAAFYINGVFIAFGQIAYVAHGCANRKTPIQELC